MKTLLNRRRIMLVTLNNSPYSETATAILKEDFPDYWNDIKAYGIANSNMVQFVNEDPYVICSLMDVGATRWLKNDEDAYISQPRYINATCIFELDFKPLQRVNNTTSWLFGSYESATKRYTISELASGAGLRVQYANKAPYEDNITQYGDEVVVSIDCINNIIKVNNGLPYSDGTFASLGGTYNPPYLFAVNTGSSIYKGIGLIKYFKVTQPSNSSLNMLLVPFIRNGVLGMLDISEESSTFNIFYANAASSGAFTIEFEGCPYLNITSTIKTHIINTYGESAWESVKTYFSDPTKEGLVKYVNEDPDFVVSLGLIARKARFLIGDRTAYIDTNSNVTNTDRYEAYAKNIGTNAWHYGNNADTSRALTYYLSSNASGNTNVRFGNTAFSTMVSNLAGEHTIVHDATGLKLDGSYLGTYSDVGTFNSAASVLLFAARSSSGVYSLISSAKFAYFNKYNTSTNQYVYKFVPYKKANNDCGMLDLVTLEYFGNANNSGTFSVSVENS